MHVFKSCDDVYVWPSVLRFKTHKLLNIFLVAKGKSTLILSFCIDFKKESFRQTFSFDVRLSTYCEAIQTKKKKKEGKKGIFRNIFIHTTCRLEQILLVY